MPLSWNEIKDRALVFSRDWAHAESEDAEAKSFWDAFFNIYGVSRKRVATFEHKAKKLDGKDGYIDLLWKGKLLVEHKSKGKDLDRAFAQAKDYFPGLKEHELPRYILVSDFARFRLYDLESDGQHEFLLKDLPKQVKLFGFLAGYTAHTFKDEDPVNVRAAERMGLLHDELKKNGYEGHQLEVLLVRLLFCLFADDTGIWPPSQFHDLIQSKTGVDGTDLGPMLAKIFQTLDTPPNKRQKALDEDLLELAYVNGKLFNEQLPLADFSSKTRDLLLEAAALDWSAISPAIFGSLFQSVMDSKLRRNLGAHYTSEKNILKLIGPLFLDDLKAELDKIGHDHNKLKTFHTKLASLKFLDPACGCGNFLVIAYRELRQLETEVLRRLYLKQRSAFVGVADHVAVNVDQFYGIEVEEFPAQIAQVALWLMDHQMNRQLSDVFEENFARLPLLKSATIAYGPTNGNALRVDWGSVIPHAQLSYVFGNPPFVGKNYQSPEQRSDKLSLMSEIHNASDLDLVAAWFVKAIKVIRDGAPQARAAFVSTNSITQGEQAPLLWNWMFAQGAHIDFAHRTFVWTNEAPEAAAVHCVLIGFSLSKESKARLFDYQDGLGEPHEISAKHINGYLVDAPHIPLVKRQVPICDVPSMGYGSKPTDGGLLLLSEEERSALIAEEPASEKYIRPFVKNSEFLSGNHRFCLWLVECSPVELRSMPKVLERVSKVRELRLKSTAPATRKAAERPSLFFYINQPSSRYLLFPGISSEARKYIPLGFVQPKVIAGDNTWIVPNAGLYHFGVLQSRIHMAWTRSVSGRIKSDFQYSASIVFNNFPWPDSPTEHRRTAIERAAEAVLDARENAPNASLADLYDPNAMPIELTNAHQELDRAVETAYGRASFQSDAERVAFLFELYQKFANVLPLSGHKMSKSKRPKRK